VSTTVSGSGIEVISTGATASGLTIAGGQALVFANATVSATTITAGQAYVSGTTVSTRIVGGDEFILAGGHASAATVSGGFEVISSGGSTDGAVIDAGGGLIVYAGGGIGASLTLAGGVAYIGGPIGAGSTVTFSGSGGRLVLDDPASFAGHIAGLNLPSQLVDLSGFAYSSAETRSWTEAANNTSGTLTVTDGAKTATLTLLGSYVTSNFTLSSDGAGGTLIVDPPIRAPTLMAQAMASVMPVGGGSEGHHNWGHWQDTAGRASSMVTPTSGMA
jgi:autotransporter passenger strand-loop-strand repeat protein